jgi:hypothetical protein
VGYLISGIWTLDDFEEMNYVRGSIRRSLSGFFSIAFCCVHFYLLFGRRVVADIECIYDTLIPVVFVVF